MNSYMLSWRNYDGLLARAMGRIVKFDINNMIHLSLNATSRIRHLRRRLIRLPGRVLDGFVMHR